MRDFVNYKNMYGGGKFAVLVPGVIPFSASRLNLYTQEECVIRMALSGSSTTARVHATVAANTGGGNPTVAETDISFELGDVQYYDITDVVRADIPRTLPSLTPADTAASGEVMFGEYDSGGLLIGTTILFIYAYDAVEPSGLYLQSPLPSTFRLLPNAHPEFTNGAARIVSETNRLDIYFDDGTVDQTFSGTYGNERTVAWQFHRRDAEIVVTGHDTYNARVLWETCESDKVQLRWWSPMLGAWKSCAVELMGGGVSVTDTQAFVMGFDRRSAHRGGERLLARIPLCTPDDVAYYSDIYISDLVEMEWVTTQDYAKVVTIQGTPPAYRRSGKVDLEFDIILSEVSTLC